jgi:hypothetical protein
VAVVWHRLQRLTMASTLFPVPQRSRNLTAFAWSATVLASTVPDIIWIELAKDRPASWVLYDCKLGLMLVLFLIACVWKPARPLRNFFLVMFAFLTLLGLRPRINFMWPALQAVFGGGVFDQRMQAEQTGKLAVSLVMIALLLMLGYKRRDFFLACGDLRAPIEPVRLLGFPKPDPLAVVRAAVSSRYRRRSGGSAVCEFASDRRRDAQSSADVAIDPLLRRFERLQ